MDVSIIIVNYNTLLVTKQCIDSIIAKTKSCSYEIIVVDNNSTDGSIEALTNDSRIIFIEAGENLGFGMANNIGIEKATGKYLFFLNSDTYLLNDAVSCFFNFCESHNELKLGAVGTLLLNPDGGIVHSFARFPTLLSLFGSFYIYPFYKLLGKKYKRYDTTDSDQSDDFFKVDYVTGADLFVDKSVVLCNGGFDPDFFMYWEETEMQYRWTVKGYDSYILKSPQIVHLEGYTSKKGCYIKFSENKFFWGLESQKLYFKKCYSKAYYYAFRILWLSNLLPILRGKYNMRQIRKMTKILFHL